MKEKIAKLIKGIGSQFFSALIKSRRPDAIQKFDEEEIENSYQHFKKYFPTSLLFRDASSQDREAELIRGFAIKNALAHTDKNGIYLEFGVDIGNSINFFGRMLAGHGKEIFGFDAFRGLSEDWAGTFTEASHFDRGGNPPVVEKNVKLLIGWVEDTLPSFLENHKNEKINFAHLDMDTYTPTKFTLRLIKPYLNDGAILLFDELYNYSGWREGEFKALMEEFEEQEIKYLAFSTATKVVIKYKKNKLKRE